jgi:hypothetical protein
MYLMRCDNPDCDNETTTDADGLFETRLPDGWIETSQEHEHQFCSWQCVAEFSMGEVSIDVQVGRLAEAVRGTVLDPDLVDRLVASILPAKRQPA